MTKPTAPFDFLTPAGQIPSSRHAVRWRVRGLVQGVGFRPFVYRLARSLGLTGWVCNDADGVLIHAEGVPDCLDRLKAGLTAAPPAAARIASLQRSEAVLEGHEEFRVVASREGGQAAMGVRVPPDRATCPACLREIIDRRDRRHGHPFASCTECGPRYSILARLPYDRLHTSMAPFVLCPACRKEYNNPECRRFHAQPIACPECGPRLQFASDHSPERCQGMDALHAAARFLREGRIIALKGIGGFQLLLRADCPEAVTRLRQRKQRPTKPLAVMVSSLEAAERLAVIGTEERRLLTSPANPIVLLELHREARPCLAAEVAPRLGRVGLMLPTTPLHHLLLALLDFPVVATSGNRGEEPILTDETNPSEYHLGDLADGFLSHDRGILNRVDDSVVQIRAGRPRVLRLARGFAPLPLVAVERLARGQPGGLLAAGGHQKVAIALWTGSQAVLSPHIGDLDGTVTRQAFADTIERFCTLYGCPLTRLACDLHPEYFTTAWARQQGMPLLQVQHHHAHAVACMAEADLLDREVLALTWDGTGYGPDGTVWGGEVLRARVDCFQRVASLRPFPLPGNERAVRQPARIALGLLAETLGQEVVLQDRELLQRLRLTEAMARTLLRMVERGINTPWTSSLGRLFDAVAALLLPVGQVSYEGEAAVWLEAVVETEVEEWYPLPLDEGEKSVVRGDWRPLLVALLADLRAGVAIEVCAARFHNAVAQWAGSVAERHPGLDVVLGGGCFQNRFLTERTTEVLVKARRRVFCPALVPPGDGGLAVGQLAVALAQAPYSRFGLRGG